MGIGKLSRPSGDNVDVVYFTLFCCYVADPYREVNEEYFKSGISGRCT
jgi:hypothetical protein